VKTIVKIGLSTCGLAAGGRATYDALKDEAARGRFPFEVTSTGCLGACHREPLVEIVEDGDTTLYGPVTPARVPALLKDHYGAGSDPEIRALVVSERADRSDYPFLGRQVKVTTQLCGVIDPLSLSDYLRFDGYRALREALKLEPEAVVDLIKQSKLRGRGGAGFPTGLKWEAALRSRGETKYVVCNADEGDPGAFMDRTMIEGDPHRLLEGMMIAAHAIGARIGYIYVRAEYPIAVKRLELAVSQALEAGYLGPRALGHGRPFEIIVKEGAGAFVCGEETALMHSIEGLRGMPRMRPPYPAQSGLWGCPTNINNVETYASVPSILLNGPTWFAGLGTERSGGTKAFALTGAIVRTGLAEVPIGLPVREMIFDVGGGIKDGRAFKAVQMGGPSGGCIPAEKADTRIDYEDLRAIGAIMGSGGMVVVDDTTCMVDLTRFFLEFTQSESCGKCIPCRLGTRKMLDAVRRFTLGEGRQKDLDDLPALAEMIRTTSLCGLGQTAPNPVLSTMRYFRDEYEAHVQRHTCPAGACTALGRV
jgi:NADH-quinone oxidoreductase subunit F